MAVDHGFTLWDDEFKLHYWTPQEISDSKKRVSYSCEIIQDTQNGLSLDEATIRCFINHPDFADELLDDAISLGDINEAQRLKKCINEAKLRSNTQYQSYWSDVVNHAKNDVNNGFDLNIIFKSLNDALNIVKVAMA